MRGSPFKNICEMSCRIVHFKPTYDKLCSAQKYQKSYLFGWSLLLMDSSEIQSLAIFVKQPLSVLQTLKTPKLFAALA
jgi:hypothetical protein